MYSEARGYSPVEDSEQRLVSRNELVDSINDRIDVLDTMVIKTQDSEADRAQSQIAELRASYIMLRDDLVRYPEVSVENADQDPEYEEKQKVAQEYVAKRNEMFEYLEARLAKVVEDK